MSLWDNFLKQGVMLPQFAHGVLETGLNYLIKETPQVKPTLRLLAGQVLQLQLTKPDYQLFILFSEQRCDLLAEYEGTPNCCVSLEAQSLPRLRDKAQLSELINQQVLRFSGDLQVLQRFSALLEELETSPTEQLAKVVGDIPAQTLEQVGKTLFGQLKRKGELSGRYWVENLQNERPVFIHTLQAVHFYDQIAELAEQAENIHERIVQLEQRFTLAK